jgi:hypothetical protein
MKRAILLMLTGLTGIHFADAQTKTVTVDANDVLNNNTKIVAQTSLGQSFFTGHQLGSTYSYPSAGIFRAWTDQPTGSANYYYDGITNGTLNFSVRADGQGYFAGNVGIGTNSPYAKFTVYNSAPLGSAAKNNVLLSSVSSIAGTTNNFKNNLWIVRNAPGSDWYTARLHDGISIDGAFGNPQTDTRTWWERDPSQDIQSWGTLGNTYLSINAGNVGIGTSTPNDMLDVNGYSIFGPSVEKISIGGGSLGFNRKVATGAIYNNTKFAYQFQHTGSTTAGSDYLALQVYNPGGAGMNPTSLVINGSSQVGVNTSYIPTGYQFAVNGSAIATSITVQLRTNWPDYVFKKGYTLPVLSDVKTYIDRNHHLPEIPSEQEVAKNGINLGEMNKLLLKKVEELTLYLIEKDKNEKENTAQLKIMAQEIANLKKQVTHLNKK